MTDKSQFKTLVNQWLNVKAELKDGYLTISATSASQKDEKDSDGVYIRRERYAGACSRSFYVGEDVK